jgi:hypothetical protein
MKKLLTLDQPHDSAAMKEAIAWCRTKALDARRNTDFQLKIGLINFYPEKGTIFVDRVGTLPDRGLPVLKSLIAQPHRTLLEIKASLKTLNLLPGTGEHSVSLRLD